jgi:hypothetical protein
MALVIHVDSDVLQRNQLQLVDQSSARDSTGFLFKFAIVFGILYSHVKVALNRCSVFSSSYIQVGDTDPVRQV